MLGVEHLPDIHLQEPDGSPVHAIRPICPQRVDP
jgi:hypothetical protein